METLRLMVDAGDPESRGFAAGDCAGGGDSARGWDGGVSDGDGVWAGGECAGCGSGGKDFCGEGAAELGSADRAHRRSGDAGARWRREVSEDAERLMERVLAGAADAAAAKASDGAGDRDGGAGESGGADAGASGGARVAAWRRAFRWRRRARTGLGASAPQAPTMWRRIWTGGSTRFWMEARRRTEWSRR